MAEEKSTFEKWMGPTLDALRDLGGSSPSSKVLDWIEEHFEITNWLAARLKSGQTKLYNHVHWGRQVLVWEGLLGHSKRGVWTLTPRGRETSLDETQARRIWKKWNRIQTTIKSREAILKAIEECDHLGREEFLAKYGFERTRNNILVHNGKTYDSKAIVAVACSYESPKHGLLNPEDLSAGSGMIQRWLENEGFELRELFPNEVEESAEYLEGAVRKITINAYERDTRARHACIEHWGLNCAVCGFNFGAVYGELGEGFIHVHHLRDLATIGKEYQVDPVKDLRPVCPNCHAMLHIKTPAISIEKLQEILDSRTCTNKSEDPLCLISGMHHLRHK